MSDQAEVTETKVTKSIVNPKYAGKYKGGNEDALAQFINDQCKGSDGFDYNSFFELSLKNGVPQEQIDKYRPQIEEKRHGSQGRTRMTLRNIIATNVRKTGKAIALDGTEVSLHLDKPQVTGAAATAKDSKASNGGEDAASQF
jgi:hypothetical protein